MFRLELLQLVGADIWDDMEPYSATIALLRARAAMTDNLSQPAIQKLRDGILLRRNIDACALVAMQCLELSAISLRVLL